MNTTHVRKLLAVILAACISYTSYGQNGLALKTNTVDTMYGKAVIDPYRRMEDTADALVKKYMRQEAAKSIALFQGMPGMKKLREQVATAINNSKEDEIERIRVYKNKLYVLYLHPKPHMSSQVPNPGYNVWYNSGGITAYSHVRGGGIYGEEWHTLGALDMIRIETSQIIDDYAQSLAFRFWRAGFNNFR